MSDAHSEERYTRWISLQHTFTLVVSWNFELSRPEQCVSVWFPTKHWTWTQSDHPLYYTVDKSRNWVWCFFWVVTTSPTLFLHHTFTIFEQRGKKNQKHWITVTQFKQKGRNHMIFQLINMYNRYCSKLLENPLLLGVMTRNVEVLVRSVEETRFSSVKEILTTAFWSLSPTKLCA
jgi:hypothetical protein